MAVLALAPSAIASTPCAEHVIQDWRDNGRIDGLYELTCYQDAIDAIPADIRNYADADEVILRALQAAARSTGVNVPKEPATRRVDPKPPPAPPLPPVDTAATTGVPLPLLVLAGVSVLLLACGSLGYVARRRRLGASDDGLD